MLYYTSYSRWEARSICIRFSRPYILQTKSILANTNRYIVTNNKDADLDYLSESDLECLNHSISLCKDLNFEELTKKSHGLAWENTARDRVMSYADILREEGDTEGYVEYITNKMELESSFC